MVTILYMSDLPDVDSNVTSGGDSPMGSEGGSLPIAHLDPDIIEQIVDLLSPHPSLNGTHPKMRLGQRCALARLCEVNKAWSAYAKAGLWSFYVVRASWSQMATARVLPHLGSCGSLVRAVDHTVNVDSAEHLEVLEEALKSMPQLEWACISLRYPDEGVRIERVEAVQASISCVLSALTGVRYLKVDTKPAFAPEAQCVSSIAWTALLPATFAGSLCVSGGQIAGLSVTLEQLTLEGVHDIALLGESSMAGALRNLRSLSITGWRDTGNLATLSLRLPKLQSLWLESQYTPWDSTQLSWDLSNCPQLEHLACNYTPLRGADVDLLHALPSKVRRLGLLRVDPVAFHHLAQLCITQPKLEMMIFSPVEAALHWTTHRQEWLAARGTVFVDARRLYDRCNNAGITLWPADPVEWLRELCWTKGGVLQDWMVGPRFAIDHFGALKSGKLPAS